MSRRPEVDKLKPGDVVIYDPPDLTRSDYAKEYIGSLGVVTEEKPTGAQRHVAEVDETHVRWISSKTEFKPVTRHYTCNLRKIGHIELPTPDQQEE